MRVMGAVLGGAIAVLAAAPAAGAKGVHVDPGMLEQPGVVPAIVTAAPGTSLSQARATAARAGVEPGAVLRTVHGFSATGTAAAYRRLARMPGVARIDWTPPAPRMLDTAHRATRGQDLLDGTTPMGRIDGSGIGVAVVDSGIDELHPDFAGRIGTNVRRIPLTGLTVPGVQSDVSTLGGHGTHVSGIVVGTGAGSAGRYRGAAPGATLHSISDGGALLWSVNPHEGWQWILDNLESFQPRVRVVNNSFGLGWDEYDPEDAQIKLIDALVARGVVMVFSAGNSGGDGSAPMTSRYCAVPTPGVLCVANYDDRDSGTFAGTVYPTSSRGQQGLHQSYPDLMAPGSLITAACRPWLPVCHLGDVAWTEDRTEYARLSGTSMAAPMVAGIVAQMLQANPALTPAQVEEALVATARKVPTGAPDEPDPRRPGTHSFDKGHGLVDARAAVERVFAG